MNEIEFKHYTEIETPETNEIEYHLDKIAQYYNRIVLIEVIVLTIFSAIIWGNGVLWSISLPVTLLSYAIFLVPTAIIYSQATSDLKKKLKIAQLNDRVRHEEKIRIKERLKYKEQFKEEPFNFPYEDFEVEEQNEKTKEPIQEIEQKKSDIETDVENILRKLPKQD